jgi:L-asparagine permease
MPGAPVTNYISLAFLLIVVLSNVTSESGRWTLALFALVAIAMVAGWYAVRNSIKPDLLDNVVPSDEGM